MSLGHSRLIKIVFEMGGDPNAKMKNGLSTLHCAAQTYHGLLSMLILVKQHQVPVNLIDSKNATPLHFACMHKETKNVEYLISQKCPLDVQDKQGNAPIHICIIRLLQDPEQFDDYKRIIKSLLFAGASRELRTKNGQTPIEMLEAH